VARGALYQYVRKGQGGQRSARENRQVGEWEKNGELGERCGRGQKPPEEPDESGEASDRAKDILLIIVLDGQWGCSSIRLPNCFSNHGDLGTRKSAIHSQSRSGRDLAFVYDLSNNHLFPRRILLCLSGLSGFRSNGESGSHMLEMTRTSFA